MTSSVISDLSDPRLEPYRDIRNRNWTEQSGIFVAEGPLLVQRLLRSEYACRSILLDEKFVDHYPELVDPDNELPLKNDLDSGLPEQLLPDTELLVLKHELLPRLIGFKFHRGVLGCGLRKELNTLKSNLPELDRRETLVALVGVQDPENLGSIVRTCAALGVRNVLLGPGTADPLGRRALRVSVGTALRVNFFRCRDLISDMDWLRKQRRVTCLASSLGPAAETIERLQRSGPILVLFGNERHGLPADIQTASDQLIRIDMQLDVDSLNVSIAAGIILYNVTRLGYPTATDTQIKFESRITHPAPGDGANRQTDPDEDAHPANPRH